MATEQNIFASRLSAPHIPLGPCPQCFTPIEFFIPPTATYPAGATVQVRCFKCARVIPHRISPPRTAQSPPPPPTRDPRRGRKIGSQEKPLETGYYDTLGVPVDASTDDIKKAYRRLAIKHHPDKNRGDPNADEKFKEIAIAYQVLSDMELRRKYNEFGPKEGAPEGGYIDPEEVFSAIFGGERFVPIIGEISLGKDMKAALQEADEMDSNGDANKPRDARGKEILTPEEKAKKEEKEKKVAAERAKAREIRVQKLVDILERKLSIYTESATGINDREVARSWREICNIEAEELKKESYGVELLQTVGFVYTSKARHYLASSNTFMGVGGWLHNVQGKYHIFSETVSTVRSALELKQVFEQIAQAEKSGASPEERKKLEEQAAEKGLQALFKGAKLEIESIIRETCDRVLTSPNVPQDKLLLRTYALQELGEAYMSIRKDGDMENEYVRVDTRASKEREAGRRHS